MLFGFLTDALSTLNLAHDSSVELMKAAQTRGHEIWQFESRALGFARNAVWVQAQRLEHVRKNEIRIVNRASMNVSELDAVFLREDPPVDAAFLHSTQLLELVEPQPFYMNAPSGLRFANEKLLALRFSDLMPATIVTANPNLVRDFVFEHHKVVLKPLDGCGGQGILIVSDTDRGLISTIEWASARGNIQLMAQAFVEESLRGDKRIFLLGGEPLGALLRVPSIGDFRGNLAAGATPEWVELSKFDIAVCERLKPLLVEQGLHFVGLDMLGEFVTEINVTSPTGLVEWQALSGRELSNLVIQYVEKHVKKPR